MSNAFYRSSSIELSEFSDPPKIFLAEGESEAYFLEKLFRNEGCDPEQYAVFCYKGNSRLAVALKALHGQEIFSVVTTIGVMTDADSNYQGRRASVLNEFRKIKYIGPNVEDNDGVAVDGDRTLGIFVSPGNGQAGRIENLVLEEITRQPEHSCIENLSACYRKIREAELSEKALCQIYISMKKDSMCGVGRAFNAGVLKITDPAYADAVKLFTTI